MSGEPKVNQGQLFADLPTDAPEESFLPLVMRPGVKIERIVSQGHASPPGFWYDQELNEWVILLRGQAIVEFAEPPTRVELAPGDYLTIAAHQRHRVVWTTPHQPTVWLAVHYP